ncbi:MAG: peptidoglycan D,D-transpeptidase FtsI family protein [Bacillota bacterium]
MDGGNQKRIIGVFYLLLLGFLGLAGHMAYIMVYRHDFYAARAVSQQSQRVPMEIPLRGDILDRRLNPLTGLREEDRLVVFPAAMADRPAVVRQLAQIMGVKEQAVNNVLGIKPRVLPFTITPGQAGQLKAARLPGVLVGRYRQRNGVPDLAAHVLGYVGKVSAGQEIRDLQALTADKSYSLGDWVGKMGLELYYDGDLKGTAPTRDARAYVDGKGRLIPGLGYKIESGLTDSTRRSLVLTLDKVIQREVEMVMDEMGITAGAVIVMDPYSGDILAMASRPEYSLAPAATVPAAQDEGIPTAVYSAVYNGFLDRNTRLFQPGSIFKVVVAAAALEEGVAQPESRFLCLGEKDDYVRCYEPAGHGLLDFNQAMAVSCNPTFARLGLKLGAEKLIDYARRFGMDKQGIIGYPYPPDRRQQLDAIAGPYNLVNSSLGQGPVLASPVQVTAMMAAIADNGIYKEPRLVKKIIDYTGTTVRSFPAGPGRKAVSEETAGKLRLMLETVTLYGTGRGAYVGDGGSAGKTGSAQSGAAGTSVDAWFSGYAPVKNPRYVVTVMIERGESGGKTAAPVFKAIMERILAFPPASD